MTERQRYRGAYLVPRRRGKVPPPSWLDLVTIDWPAAPELHGMELQRDKAEKLIDWRVDTGGDQSKLPPPWRSVGGPRQAALPVPAPPPPLPPPEPAARIAPDPRTPAGAALALRAVLDKTAPMPKSTEQMHLTGRPKFWWMYRYAELPGLVRVHAGSTRTDKVEVTYTHDLLPGWEYLPSELREMVEDLNNLAAGKGQPAAPTRGPGSKPPPKPKPAAAQGGLL